MAPHPALAPLTHLPPLAHAAADHPLLADDLPLLVAPSGPSGDLGLGAQGGDVDSDSDTESDSEAAAAAEGARRAELDPLGAGIPTSIVPDVFVRSPLPAGSGGGSGRSGGGSGRALPSPTASFNGAEAGRDGAAGAGGGSGGERAGGGGSFAAAIARVSWSSSQVAGALALPSFAAGPLSGRPPKHPASASAASSASASTAGPRTGEEPGQAERSWRASRGESFTGPEDMPAGVGEGGGEAARGAQATAASAEGGEAAADKRAAAAASAVSAAAARSGAEASTRPASSERWPWPEAGSEAPAASQLGRALDSPEVWWLPAAAEASEATASAAACRSALREASARHLRTSIAQARAPSKPAKPNAPVVARCSCV